MRPHKRGQARVTLNGRDFYLGPWGSLRARLAYDELVTRWLAAGRSIDAMQRPETVDELGDRWLEHAEGYYVKGGRPTSRVQEIRHTLHLLSRSGLGPTPLPEFGPRRLKEFRVWMLGHPEQAWCRTTINARVASVVQMFGWGVEEELLDESIWQRLRSVRPLRRGRSVVPGRPPPREGRRVLPVERARIAATLRRVPRRVARMILVQYLAGMRPSELMAMRPMDLAPTSIAGVVAYRVPAEANKLEHMQIARTVLLGPRALRIIARELDESAPELPVFRPLRGRARPYPVSAYRRCIRRACETEPRLEPWSPNQLRHARATETASALASERGLEVASLILGHKSITTTMRYVDVPDERAAEAVLRAG